MNRVIRLAIVDPNDGSRSSVKNLLMGIDTVWLEAECSNYAFFSDLVKQTQPDIALISLDADPTAGLDLISQISVVTTDCTILVVSNSTEGSLILQAMRNGAGEFLNSPLNLDDFLAALDRIQQTLADRSGEGKGRSSKVITVAGVSGGVGCTSLSINLACMLAQHEENNVAIVDLDLALGDADVWLDIIPDYTIQDVAENITRLDYSLLKRSLTKHECGAFLLPRPVQLEINASFAPEELSRVLTLLKATFTHLVVDISKSFNSLDLAAMESSDAVLLITQLDLPCLRNVVRLMQFFDTHEGITDKVRVVVNRIGLEETSISLNKALETIGREIYWQIPNDYASMVESRNNGVPLLTHAPRAKLTKAIEELSDMVDMQHVDEEESEDRPKRKRLFSFLGNKPRD